MIKKGILSVFFVLFILTILEWGLSGIRKLALRNEVASPDHIEALFFIGSKTNEISQGYGATLFARTHYRGHWHNGIDLAARTGTPILSLTDGVVIAAGNQDAYCYKRGYGKFVAIKGNDFVHLYAHLRDLQIKTGDQVKKGNQIGTVGETGYETGPHLHLTFFEQNSFEMIDSGCGPDPRGKDLDPTQFIKGLVK